MIYHYFYLKKHGIKTYATVNSIVEKYGAGMTVKHKEPVLTFLDKSNNIFQVDSFYAQFLKKKIDLQYPIIYKPDNPNIHTINEIRFVLIPICVIGLGLIFYLYLLMFYPN